MQRQGAIERNICPLCQSAGDTLWHRVVECQHPFAETARQVMSRRDFQRIKEILRHPEWFPTHAARSEVTVQRQDLVNMWSNIYIMGQGDKVIIEQTQRRILFVKKIHCNMY